MKKDKITDRVSLELIEKILSKTGPVFNHHIAIVRDIKTSEQDHCFSVGFSNALEQVHLLLSFARSQLEKGEPISFDAPQESAVAEEAVSA